ncbi:MAG: radical SAM protein [Chlorobiaceae bacterium]|jgi:anaerobic magnesium-protoporphyrin IX monomethyl ester cyclase|nr:radical SAM protein [Chlorobiaceae bacterium]
MAYFKHICFVEAPQAVITPFPRYVTDCIGILYLAAAVKDIAESLVIPDNYYNDRLFDSFRSLLKKRKCDLVAISCMTGGFNNAVRLAEIAKSHGSSVVLGGFHPTALPDEVLKLDCVDLVVLGEGEATFRELVLKGPSREVRGIAWKENGGITYTGERPLIEDIDSIAFPLRSLRPSRLGEKGSDYSIDTIYTSRGCPWSCSFCANSHMHQYWRSRSPENVVEEIALLHNPKKKKLLKIWDANFLTNIKRVEAICDLMIERGLTNFKIMMETRAKDIVRSERILGKLRKIGLKTAGLGIESPNSRTLELMNKSNAMGDVSRAICLMNQHAIDPEGYFIIGHHTENMTETMAYPEFAKALGLPLALFMVITPYPGTKIFDEYRQEGNITSFDWDLYNNFSPVIKTEHMDPAALVKMMAYCNVAFCSYKSILKKEHEPGILVSFLYELFQTAFLMRVNLSLGEEEIREAVFDAYLVYLGSSPVLECEIADSAKKLRRAIVVRLQDSPSRAIDYLIEEKDGKRTLSMVKRFDGKPSAGPVIRLDELVAAVCSVPMDALMHLLYRVEIFSNNPVRTADQLFSLLGDREVRNMGRKLVALYTGWLRGKESKGGTEINQKIF